MSGPPAPHPRSKLADGAWRAIADFEGLALSTLTRKVLEAALAAQPPRQAARERPKPRIMPK